MTTLSLRNLPVVARAHLQGFDATYSVRKLERILLVDDDPSILTAWKRILQLEGHCVETAGDGATGMALAKRVQPGIIVTDRSLPRIDGIELCRRLRREPALAKIPIVLATAEYDVGFSAPVWDELWQKPVSIETMRESIRRLLSR